MEIITRKQKMKKWTETKSDFLNVCAYVFGVASFVNLVAFIVFMIDCIMAVKNKSAPWFFTIPPALSTAFLVVDILGFLSGFLLVRERNSDYRQNNN